MKKNFLLIALLSTLPTALFAATEFYTATPDNAKTGILIVPVSEMRNSESMKRYLKDPQTQGYFFKESNEVKQMIQASQENYSYEIKNNSDPKDTHLKKNLNNIQLAFNYNGLPFLNPIGYAPGGAYIPNTGWTMIGTFFNDKTVGSCEYRLNNMKLAHGAVLIPKESVRYVVNNKVSNIFVEGSKTSGFMYTVNWNDEIYNHFLICANMKFDNHIIDQMIELAKKIDRSMKSPEIS